MSNILSHIFSLSVLQRRNINFVTLYIPGSAENLYRGQSVGPRRSGIPVLTSTAVKGDQGPWPLYAISMLVPV